MPKARGQRDLLAVSGPQLARLLLLDGWEAGRRGLHGQLFSKRVADGLLTTTLPHKSTPIPKTTLGLILGPKQTQLGKAGLRALIEKHGLR